MTNHLTATAALAAASAVASRADMTAAIDIVTEAIERRNTFPVLSNVRLMGERGEFLFLTGTDQDCEITARIPAASDASFAATVPAHVLRDLLKKAPKSDYVALSGPNDDMVTADFERVRYTLKALPVADFPVLSAPSGNHRFTMTGAAFWTTLDRTRGAMSVEETRYYLNGIFMHADDAGNLHFVGCDGHRLYKQTMAAPDGSEAIPAVIIPRKSIALLHKLTKGKRCPEGVEIEVTESRIRFGFTTPDGIAVTVTSKIVDGTFPDYQRVIPTGNDKVATFATDDFAEAIKGVSLISSDRGRACRLDFDNGNCALAVENPDQGKASADVACTYVADPLSIGFNHAYMLDVLAIFGDRVHFHFGDAGSPAIIDAPADLPGFTAVLMPMRV